MPQKPLTVRASGLYDSSAIPFLVTIHFMPSCTLSNLVSATKLVGVRKFLLYVHLKSAFDDVILKMEKNGATLRFALLNDVYMSCDSSFVKLGTGLMFIVALGSLSE